MYQNDFGRSFGGSFYPLVPGTSEISLLQQRVDTLCAQLSQLTEIVLRTSMIQGVAQGFGQGIGQGVSQSVGAFGVSTTQRVRESDSHLFWDIALPNIGMGDLEVEVAGNRVICRTRVPVRANFRAISAELPRGLDIFELPDGRVELNWIVPVTFVSKEVEAIHAEGRISICIPKAEVSARHSVKITKEAARKSPAHEMTA